MNNQATFCEQKNLFKNCSGLKTFKNAICSMIKEETFVIIRDNANGNSIFIKNTGAIA